MAHPRPVGIGGVAVMLIVAFVLWIRSNRATGYGFVTFVRLCKG